jgi:hypothetical protein
VAALATLETFFGEPLSSSYGEALSPDDSQLSARATEIVRDQIERHTAMIVIIGELDTLYQRMVVESDAVRIKYGIDALAEIIRYGVWNTAESRAAVDEAILSANKMVGQVESGAKRDYILAENKRVVEALLKDVEDRETLLKFLIRARRSLIGAVGEMQDSTGHSVSDIVSRYPNVLSYLGR